MKPGRQLVAAYLRLRRRFYDGPAVFGFPGRRIEGYRSPTVLMVLWLDAWRRTCLTPAGSVLFVALGLFGMAGMLSPLMPVYFLSFAVLGLFVVDLAVGWLTRPRLTVRRQLPAAGAADTPLPVEYTVTNTGGWCWDVAVDTVGLPRLLRFAPQPRGVTVLKPGETVRVRARLIADRRGEYHPPLPVVDSAFPFGLWRWGSRGRATQPLRIFPKYTPLRSLWLPPEQQFRTGGETAAAVAGESLHFMACRPYRYGDSPRRLHARSWARLNVPVIKEFSDEHRRRAVLLVDTCPPRSRSIAALRDRLLQREHEPLEAALALAAAMADFLIGNAYDVDLLAPGQRSGIVAAGRGEAGLNRMLEELAVMRRGEATDLPPVTDEVLYELSAAGGALLILLQWDASRQRLAAQLRDRGIVARMVFVGSPGPTNAPPAVGTWLDPAAIRGGRVTELDLDARFRAQPATAASVP